MDISGLKHESRYGMPAADQIITNRHYTVGYSYYFRQPKWALEIVDQEKIVERSNNFRPDYRVPEMFRADLADYVGSKHDRGHLVASANKVEDLLQNSETFLLSNMSPQKPNFNQRIWQDLEDEVRRLDKKKKVVETYVICGPIFYFDKAMKVIGAEDDNGVTLPIPHSFFKSVLAESKTGALQMWSFILSNKASNKPLGEFRVPTTLVEKLAGIKLWERLVGSKIEREKSRVRRMW